MEDWALACDLDEVLESPVVQGYIEILQRVGRSVKKNPPTVPALIRNIQHRGSLPHINSIIDIYNVKPCIPYWLLEGMILIRLRSDRIHRKPKGRCFSAYFVQGEACCQDGLCLSGCQRILAWLDVRDSEYYKFDEETKVPFYHSGECQYLCRNASGSLGTNPSRFSRVHA